MTRELPPGIERAGRQWRAEVLTVEDGFIPLGKFSTIQAALDAQHEFWRAWEKSQRKAARTREKDPR